MVLMINRANIDQLCDHHYGSWCQWDFPADLGDGCTRIPPGVTLDISCVADRRLRRKTRVTDTMATDTRHEAETWTT